jgi:exodeoxyribonuclease-5
VADEPILNKPDYQLQEIHRTAQDSPLVKMAHAIRTKQYVPIEPYRDDHIRIMSYFKGGREFLDKLEYNSETVTLCFTNAVRQSINHGYRHKKGYDSNIILYPYEQIVCLTNNPNLGMMNGERFTIEFLSPPFDQKTVNITVERQDGKFQEAFVHNTLQKFGKKNNMGSVGRKSKYGGKKQQQPDPMVIDADYGYAMTVHKAQGSEFKNVCLVDSSIFKGISKSKRNDDYLRWLYTGVTRSSDQLTLITDYPNA